MDPSEAQEPFRRAAGRAEPAGLVLVTGASGTIGRRLVPALVAAGYRVRAMVR